MFNNQCPRFTYRWYMYCFFCKVVKLCCWTVYFVLNDSKNWYIIFQYCTCTTQMTVEHIKVLYTIYMRVVKFKIVSWNHSALLVSFSPCIVKYSLCFTVLSCRYFVTFSFSYPNVSIRVFRFSYFLVKYLKRKLFYFIFSL